MPLSRSVLIPVALAHVLSTKPSLTSLWKQWLLKNEYLSSLQILVNPDARFPTTVPSLPAGWGIRLLLERLFRGPHAPLNGMSLFCKQADDADPADTA